MRAFEEGLLTLVRTKNADILEDIRKTSDLSDATAAKLKSHGGRLRQDVCLTPSDRHAAGDVAGLCPDPLGEDEDGMPGTRPGMTKERQDRAESD